MPAYEYKYTTVFIIVQILAMLFYVYFYSVNRSAGRVLAKCQNKKLSHFCKKVSQKFGKLNFKR